MPFPLCGNANALQRAFLERLSAFLREACAGDEALGKEVESLLARREQAADFIEAPTIEATSQYLESKQAQLWELSTSYGLSGWLLAKGEPNVCVAEHCASEPTPKKRCG